MAIPPSMLILSAILITCFLIFLNVIGSYNSVAPLLTSGKFFNYTNVNKVHARGSSVHPQDAPSFVKVDFPAGLEAKVPKHAPKLRVRQCDYSIGEWVPDKNYPAYQHCPYIRPSWNCKNSTRTNFSYENWRWKPFGCELPRFDAKDFLMRLRNRVLGIVGDSLGFQQYQSLLCLAYTGASQPPTDLSVDYGYSDVRILDGKNLKYAYHFSETNTTLIFMWSSTLCKAEQRDGFVALHLDEPDSDLEYVTGIADVVVVNSGHHWNLGKLKQNKWQFFFRNKPIQNKYYEKPFTFSDVRMIAMRRVVRWLARNVRVSRDGSVKPLVYVRTQSTEHFMGGGFSSGGHCDHIKKVMNLNEIRSRHGQDHFTAHALKGSRYVGLLNVTYMTRFRGDAHPSRWDPHLDKGKQDCLHWCLPGVPDSWNEILYDKLRLQFDLE